MCATKLAAPQETWDEFCLTHHQNLSSKRRTWQRVSTLQSVIKLLNYLWGEDLSLAAGRFSYPRGRGELNRQMWEMAAINSSWLLVRRCVTGAGRAEIQLAEPISVLCINF